MDAFGRRLRAFRKLKHMTQADLARALGVSVATIGGIERGTRRPSDHLIGAIASALAIDVEELWGGRGWQEAAADRRGWASLDAWPGAPDEGLLEVAQAGPHEATSEPALAVPQEAPRGASQGAPRAVPQETPWAVPQAASEAPRGASQGAPRAVPQAASEAPREARAPSPGRDRAPAHGLPPREDEGDRVR
ncbi:helix-turn-helix transcriptional regulator [Alicyclobacillus vulcanalis]|uniref:DNA-binding transcriptional regulator, XRE-family HTH domain n=1 Tax=Alicyclobacillus vulcanalis TaxID=252246 RepID=A0A1N7MJS1_9BACL|nr:helix-turn-helix transcriptional regulator [Alicyclobacillus vulcanalis]SIS86280.1 DNA-binding transcriptional regulator, XRE-family HTH domain [Alicyclobacillus vulcanalis]